MLDLHSHMLPEIDDGSQSLEASIGLAQEAVKNGVQIALMTPHHMNGKYLNHKKDVEKMFDMVIFDVPPLLSVNDARLLMPMIDGIIVVVSLGKTSKASIKRSMEILKISKISALGIVYNETTKKTKPKGYDYSYGYYSK